MKTKEVVKTGIRGGKKAKKGEAVGREGRFGPSLTKS